MRGLASVRILLAMLAPAIAPGAAPAAPPDPPSALDTAAAYNAWYGEPCLRLIDQCEDYIDPAGASAIAGLSCRRGGPRRARCRFTVSMPGRPAVRCRSLLRDVTGGGGRQWLPERSPRGGDRWALDVRCRAIGGGRAVRPGT